MSKADLFRDIIPEDRLFADEPMSAHTTFRVGGAADAFVIVQTEDELTSVLRACSENDLPRLIIGRGSNLLVSDQGFRGAVICTAAAAGTLAGISASEEDGCEITSGSGATLAALAAFARDRELTGLEFAAGIPGTVGGGMVMNAGAYGGELCDVVKRVYTVNLAGNVRERSAEEMEFSYRRSAISDGVRALAAGQGGDDAEIVIRAVFALARGDRQQITGKMEELGRKRREKQPLEFASAGSTWKRPEGDFAARLIEQAGCKGLSVGDAQISEKHAGFLINRGSATASDIRSLMRMVEERVYENSGVRLTPEVIPVGEF